MDMRTILEKREALGPDSLTIDEKVYLIYHRKKVKTLKQLASERAKSLAKDAIRSAHPEMTDQEVTKAYIRSHKKPVKNRAAKNFKRRQRSGLRKSIQRRD